MPPSSSLGSRSPGPQSLLPQTLQYQPSASSPLQTPKRGLQPSPPFDPEVRLPGPSSLRPRSPDPSPSPGSFTRSTTMIVLTLSPRLRRWGARRVTGAG